MEYDESNMIFTLSTGRDFPANQGILGLGPVRDDDRLRITEGYDGTVPWDEPDFVNDVPVREDGFSPAEREEIAAYMVALWQQWAKQVD